MKPSAKRILVVGSGGREHAMALALAQDRDLAIFCAPGNPGIATLATVWNIPLDDVTALVDAAVRHQIDLVIPGPEAALVSGLADALATVGIACCGPSQAAAQLEASKVFMRELTTPLGIPGPKYQVARSEPELARAVEQFLDVPVVKADGLAAGKGVFLPNSKEECLQIGRELLAGKLGPAGQQILLEERLCGKEVSLFFACHGTQVVALPHARDHKRLCDEDQGPNTGGMGAISPNPDITAELVHRIEQEFVLPVLRTLTHRQTPFVGFLFVGVMLTAEGPRLLEFNVRFGDPEAEVILPRLSPGEFLRLCEATTQGRLPHFALSVLPHATCAVVVTARGYPSGPELGHVISVDAERLHASGATLLHNGTRQVTDTLRSAGGRVLTLLGKGDSPEVARQIAYEGICAIHFAGMHYRTDIGKTPCPLVSVIMGSPSDEAVMSAAVEVLRELDISHEVRIVSAHRTPEWMFAFAKQAESRGLSVIIAGAGGAAHLPGMVASLTTVPVLGVPIPATAMQGMDALLSIVQMPRGVPVGTLAIGKPGAANAALLAAEILAIARPQLRDRLHRFRTSQRDRVLLHGQNQPSDEAKETLR